MLKILKKLPALLFILLHFSFLFAAIIENRQNTYATVILIGIVILLSIFYIGRINFDDSELRKRDIVTVLMTAFGAISTYYLHIGFELGVVLAAAIVGFTGSFIPNIKKDSILLKNASAAVYCGAFAGMTAPFIAEGYSFIILSGILAGVFLVISKNTLAGYGGKLGSIAFGGVSLVSLIIFLISGI